MLRALRLAGVMVVCLIVAGAADAKCRKDCRRQFASAFKSCKAACPRKAAGRECRSACKRAKEASLATCKSAAEPAPPLCGATTTTTATTSTTVSTLVSTTTAASTSTTTSSTTSTTLAVADTEGTVSVADVTVVDPGAAAVGGVNGGLIGIAFRDLTSGGGSVVAGTSPNGDCVVTKYDPSHLPHPLLDAGTVTIANAPPAENPATGLLKTVGPCTFMGGGGGYLCISNSDLAQPVSATGTNSTVPGTVAFQFAGTPFAGEQLVGSYVFINGFTNPHYNSGAGVFPIVGQPSDSLLVVIDPAGTTDPLEAAPTVNETIANGLAPVPGAGSAADFLGPGSVRISKPASAAFGAIDTTITAVPGEGWSLSDPGDPTNLPLAGPATNLVFGCGNGTPGDANDDTCGAAGQSPVPEMVVSGRATKQDVGSLPVFAMPSETPGVDTWLEFECRYIGSHSATLTQTALQAIIDFAPTRVEVRVINAAGAVVTDGPNQTTLLVGHAIAGHTTPP